MSGTGEGTDSRSGPRQGAMDRSDRPAASPSALLRDYRRAAALTQHELASRAGVSVGAVRDLEQGRTHRPRPAVLAALANALDLSPVQADELTTGMTASG